jgi:hypothetical protein
LRKSINEKDKTEELTKYLLLDGDFCRARIVHAFHSFLSSGTA